MSKISKKFIELADKREKALITFITCGDPSLSVTEKLVLEMEKAGADIIELGVPFSDPLADGPTIQASHLRALKKDVSAKDVFSLVSKIRKKSEIPIALLVSYNLILNYGIDSFVSGAAKSGVDGLVIPDLPPEEAGELRNSAKKNNVDTIFLAAPTSTDERIKEIAEASIGFIYLVSVAGVTGERKELSESVADLAKKLRSRTDKPIAIGFGISSPEQVKEACKIADGAIVGSAIVKIIEKNLKSKSLVKKVAGFVKRLKGATK